MNDHPPSAAGRTNPSVEGAMFGTEYGTLMEMIVDLLPDMVFVKDAESLAFVAKDREVLARGEVVEIAAEPIGTAFGERILHTKKIPLADASGTPQFLLGISEDVTDQHTAEIQAATGAARSRNRIGAVLANGGPKIVFQPIMELGTRRVVGVEALSRFDSEPYRTPDLWFRDAANIGVGVELELCALRAVTASLASLPADIYLSVNASPAAAMSPVVQAHLASRDLSRLVLELTEHDGVEDYEALRARWWPRGSRPKTSWRRSSSSGSS